MDECDHLDYERTSDIKVQEGGAYLRVDAVCKKCGSEIGLHFEPQKMDGNKYDIDRFEWKDSETIYGRSGRGPHRTRTEYELEFIH